MYIYNIYIYIYIYIERERERIRCLDNCINNCNHIKRTCPTLGERLR